MEAVQKESDEKRNHMQQQINELRKQFDDSNDVNKDLLHKQMNLQAGST
jgi:hypothetical protein